ncbi:MAG: 3-dehydroquinate synthase [Candidatus Adiutrix sp.]|jgi:3-dehydroquinate synthase|nr:3-dehydroquinate synthase [Candidatus Adiutrix sp.]
MKIVNVGLPGNNYDIMIDEGLLARSGELIAPLVPPRSIVAAAADENVWRLHGESFSASLHKAGLKHRVVIIPPGEGSKSLEGLAALYEAFADMPLRRDGLVVVFGGGVAGDLGGFAAATWMRGVRFVQVPTTLLAQVDSSVGGKTAVNLPQGKNLVGAFHQPALALIDPLLLRTLPARELRSGLAEVVKYGAIRSPRLLADLTGGGELDYAAIIAECCGIKAGIVARDERDGGERMLLNFGHTFGHALERRGGLNHGEAVAVGMVIAAFMGEAMGLARPGTAASLRSALTDLGLNCVCPCPPAELLPALAVDKKSEADGLRMAFLREPGQACLKALSFSEIKEILGKAEDRWKTQE